MNNKIDELPPIMYAKLAGVLYLIIIVCGISSEVFIRSTLIVAGDSAATVGNILAQESLFRLGFISDVIMLISDVAIAVIFYILLKPVSKTLAIMAAAFRLIQAAILGGNLLNYFTALVLLKGTGYASASDPDQLNTIVMSFLELHSLGYDLGLIFFGFSCLLTGYLVVKSGYFPVILGYGLAASGIVYLTGSYAAFMLPELVTYLEPVYLIPLIAELAFCLWLFIKGVRVR